MLTDRVQARPESYPEYLARQTLKLRQWSLLGALVMYTVVLLLDYVRFPASVSSVTVPFRVVFSILPILAIGIVFWRKPPLDSRPHFVALVIVYLSVGLTHPFVYYQAMSEGVEFANYGLVLVLLFGCLLIALPLRLAAGSTLLIIVATELTALQFTVKQGVVVADAVFLIFFSMVCLSLNKVCQVVLYSNFSLLKQLKKDVIKDDLTGVYNRRYFSEHYERLILQAQRENKSCALMFVDLDHFKQLNDTHGHAHGDLALKEIARALLSVCRRPNDFVARFGGDEFVLFFYDIKRDSFAGFCQNIVEAVRDIRLESTNGEPHTGCTVSVGGEHAENASLELFERADKAVYRAKEGGRDQFRLGE